MGWIGAIACFVVFWKGLDRNSTAMVLLGVAGVAACLMLELFVTWMFLADPFSVMLGYFG